jgi:acid phosphatase
VLGAVHDRAQVRDRLWSAAERARSRHRHGRALALSAVVAGCGGGNTSGSPSASSSNPNPSATVEVAAPATGLPTPLPTATPAATASPSPTASPTPGSGLPNFRHIYLIVMENKDYRSIVGSKAAPYLNSMIARYGLATQMYAEAHPSEPNYIALTSGGLQGTHSDGSYRLYVPNIFDQIEASGRTWHVYAQGYPSSCFGGSVGSKVVDGLGAAGQYARKHNPAISYASISGNPTRCANITRLAGFNPATADFEMIIPNQINDMHSSSTRAGDNFLRAFVPKITSSPAFADSLLFITWDEGAGGDKVGGGGHIATVIASPGMAPGSRFAGAATHYSMLRTIELAWGMPLLGEAARASTITLHY